MKYVTVKTSGGVSPGKRRALEEAVGMKAKVKTLADGSLQLSWRVGQGPWADNVAAIVAGARRTRSSRRRRTCRTSGGQFRRC